MTPSRQLAAQAAADQLRSSRRRRTPVKTTPLNVDVSMQVRDVTPPIRRWLASQFIKLAALAGISEGSISIAIVDDAHMTQLHEQFMAMPWTTDVLTFDLRDDVLNAGAKQSAPLDGELVICLDEAARQAAVRGHDTRLEALLYALHGLLHLCGYDDRNESDAAAMHAREDELLIEAGFGPVYRPRSGDAPAGR